MAKIRFTLQERTSLHFERELVAMVAALPGIEHHERPEYLDKLEILREQRTAFSQAVYAVTESIGVLIQSAGTGFLLYQVHPLLLVLPILNLISFVTDARCGTIMVEASEESAADVRLAREHFQTATTYSFSKEVRVFGLADEMLGRHRRASEDARTRWSGPPCGAPPGKPSAGSSPSPPTWAPWPSSCGGPRTVRPASARS